MHDAYRVDKGGKPTFDRVMRGLDVLKAPRVDWNVLTTIHAVNGDHGRQVYRSCATSSARRSSSSSRSSSGPPSETLPVADAGWGGGVQGTPAVHPGREPGHAPLDRPGPVRPVHDRRVRGMGPPRHRHACTCRCSTPRWPTGTARAAGCACTRRRAAASSRWSTPATCTPATTSSSPATCSATSRTSTCWSWSPRPQQRKFGQDKRDTLTRYCLRLRRAVRLQRRLPQGPLRHLTLRRARPALPLPQLPGASSTTSREPMRNHGQLLRPDRAPAELMSIYARQDAHRGRNEPCTCGSGRKWKHCHGTEPAR